MLEAARPTKKYRAFSEDVPQALTDMLAVPGFIPHAIRHVISRELTPGLRNIS